MPDLHDPTLGDMVYFLARRECRATARALARKTHPHDSVHAARKGIRRLRAVLSLASRRFEDIESADRDFRDLGKGLSRLRDADVIVVTAKVLADRGERPMWAAAIECLEHRREKMLGKVMSSDPDFTRRRKRLKDTIDRLARLPWADLTTDDVDKVVAASAKRVIKAQKRAHTEESPENIHSWRRRTRRLRMQLDAVKQLRISSAKATKRALGRFASAKEIKSFKALADRLGWYQDLQLLERILRRLHVLSDQPGLRTQLQRAIAAARP